MNRDEIGALDISINTFLKTLTVIYGESGSGKTTIIDDILYNLKNHVPKIVVFTPISNLKAYKNKIHPALIHHEITEENLNNIIERQETCAKLYEAINDIEYLKRIFNKIATTVDKIKYRQYENLKNNTINKYEHDPRLDYVKKNQLIKNIMSSYNKKILIFLKESLSRANINLLDTEEDKKAVKSLDYNPNTVLIIDDLTENVNKWGKFISTKAIFTRGRHLSLTTIITMHSYNAIPKQFRTNPQIVLFTTSEIALSYFGDKGHSFSKETIEKSRLYSKSIFNCKDPNMKYAKLSYQKYESNGNKFKYILATQREDFKFGSDQLWILLNKVSKNNEKSETIIKNILC